MQTGHRTPGKAEIKFAPSKSRRPRHDCTHQVDPAGGDRSGGTRRSAGMVALRAPHRQPQPGRSGQRPALCAGRLQGAPVRRLAGRGHHVHPAALALAGLGEVAQGQRGRQARDRAPGGPALGVGRQPACGVFAVRNARTHLPRRSVGSADVCRWCHAGQRQPLRNQKRGDAGLVLLCQPRCGAAGRSERRPAGGDRQHTGGRCAVLAHRSLRPARVPGTGGRPA